VSQRADPELSVVDLACVFMAGTAGESAPPRQRGAAWGPEAVGVPRGPTCVGQAPEASRFRLGRTHRATGWHEASPVRDERPVRAEPPRAAEQEAAPHQRQRAQPRSARGITGSCGPCGTQESCLSLDSAVPEDAIDGRRTCMSEALGGDACAGFAPMAGEVAGDTTRGLRVVPYRLEGRLAAGPLEGRAALRGVPAATAARAGWGDSGDQSAISGKLAGSLTAHPLADLIDNGQGQKLPQAGDRQQPMAFGAILHGRPEMGLEGLDWLAVQIDPLACGLAVEAHKRVSKPAQELLIRGLLEIVAGVPQETVAQAQSP
jgi:hypothetical protein